MIFYKLSDLIYVIKSNIVVKKIVLDDIQTLNSLNNRLVQNFILRNIEYLEYDHDFFKDINSRIKTKLVFITEPFYEHNNFPMFDVNNSKTIVFLDCIESFENISMISRLCECFSVDQIIFFNCNISPKAVYNSSGSLLRVPSYSIKDYVLVLKKLKDLGFQLIALTEKGINNIYQTPLNSKVVFIFGNENVGINKEILTMVDLKIRIQMTGQVSSLNVSNACSIILHHRMSQLINEN